MLYKTITLELIQARPELYEHLRAGKLVLTALETYATELRERHLARTDELRRANPGLDPRQASAEALERAIADLTGHLPSESAADAAGPLSLDAAMSFLRRPTPAA